MFLCQTLHVQEFLGQTAPQRMQEYIFIRVHAAFDGEAFEASDRKCLGQNHSVQICTNAMSCNETSTIAEQEKKMGQRIKVLCDENSIAESRFLALKYWSYSHTFGVFPTYDKLNNLACIHVGVTWCDHGLHRTCPTQPIYQLTDQPINHPGCNLTPSRLHSEWHEWQPAAETAASTAAQQPPKADLGYFQGKAFKILKTDEGRVVCYGLFIGVLC